MTLVLLLLRLLATFVLSFLFGLERQHRHKPVGFGTFSFVATGSCALAIIALVLSPNNPLPLLGAIVTGIGFLGAGALIRSGERTMGFTTASSMWFFAIFGIVMGVGEYAIALVVYLVIWAVIIVDLHLEKGGKGYYHSRLVVVTKHIVPLSRIEQLLVGRAKKYRLTGTTIDKRAHTVTAVYIIEGSKADLTHVLRACLDQRWCATVKLE